MSCVCVRLLELEGGALSDLPYFCSWVAYGKNESRSVNRTLSRRYGYSVYMRSSGRRTL